METVSMQARNAYAVLSYNGKNIKTALKDYAKSFEYSDPASGECDTVTLNLADPDNRWIGAWIPTKGDTVTAKIVYENKDGDNKTESLDCGSFLLDDFSYSESSSGRDMSISAISAPLDDAIKSTERTQNWEQCTIKQIANTIASRYHMELIFDAKDVPLSKKQQDKTADMPFLEEITKKYGLMLKMYKNKLVIFDREAYKKKEPACKLARAQLSNFSWKTTLTGTYTGAEISYTDNDTDETHTIKVGSGKRILKLNEKVDSYEDGKRIATAALNDANHSMTTASFTTMGMPNLVAGQTILITGLAKLSGKYYIDKKTDSLSGSGYTSSFEVSFVNASTDAVVIEAIDRLYKLGVLNNPAYWKNSLKKIDALGELFINASASVKTVANRDNTNNADFVKVLADRGVINSPDYWKKHLDFPYLQDLLQNIARNVL